jgi:hypothetical protein
MDYHTRITWISLPLLSLGVIIIGCSLIYLLVEQVQAEEKLRTEIQRQSEAKRRAEASRDAKTNFLSSMRSVYVGYKHLRNIQYILLAISLCVKIDCTVHLM